VGQRRGGDDHGVDAGVAEDRVGIPGGGPAVERGDLVRGDLDVASAIAACRSATRGSAAVRFLTSAANTTAAAGAPPITEA
jgi:hypothetical protein